MIFCSQDVSQLTGVSFDLIEELQKGSRRKPRQATKATSGEFWGFQTEIYPTTPDTLGLCKSGSNLEETVKKREKKKRQIKGEEQGKCPIRGFWRTPNRSFLEGRSRGRSVVIFPP